MDFCGLTKAPVLADAVERYFEFFIKRRLSSFGIGFPGLWFDIGPEGSSFPIIASSSSGCRR